MGMTAKTALRHAFFSTVALLAAFALTACTGTDISGNPTVPTDAPGPGAEASGPTVPGNVVPTIGGGAGNGAGVSGGAAGVGNGH